ncbi:hypothetical protein JC525_08990 [Alteromonas sp. IB21]|uniref:hypothetical protein n=1 Tax=Alteromonas sp. IB21 TaxID=2779369 RepID=UPI0018E76548|nr:hypothetical protein [Alteromonas sp. IB21]MBJ2129071.1 hypothetical protein [Alteromonas sp. IB21]
MIINFKPISQLPTVPESDYSPEVLLYSSCDGYHLSHAFFCPVSGEFQHFADFTERKIENPNNYKAWAFLTGEPEVIR